MKWTLSSIPLLAAWLIVLSVAPCFGEAAKDKSFDSIVKGGPFTVRDWKQIQKATQTQESARMAEFYFLVGFTRGFDGGLTLGVSEYGKALDECYTKRNFSGKELSALLDKNNASGAPAFADDVKIQRALFLTIMKACTLTNNEMEPSREKAK